MMLIDFAYLNLASRPDRRAHAEAGFAKAGLTVRRHEGELITKLNHTPTTQTLRMFNRTTGAIGCWNGQVDIIRSSSADIIGVFEDDVVLCEDFAERLDYILGHLPDDFHIMYLGATFHIPGVWCHHKDCSTWGSVGKDAWPTSNPRIMRVPAQWGTYAYLVNGARADEVLTALDAIMSDADGIDHAFIRIGTALNTYCFVPGCCKQFDSRSDIGTGVTKFSNFKSLGPYWYAEHMEDFDPTLYSWTEGKYLNEVQ